MAIAIFLPLRLSCKESSTSNQAFSIVFTTLSVPLTGDRNLRRKDVTALRCSEPLRSKVGGPSKVFAMLRGMGPPGEEIIVNSLQFIVNRLLFTDDLGDNWLMSCRFLSIFLVVSRKKRNFAAEVLNIEGIDYEKYE